MVVAFRLGVGIRGRCNRTFAHHISVRVFRREPRSLSSRPVSNARHTWLWRIYLCLHHRHVRRHDGRACDPWRIYTNGSFGHFFDRLYASRSSRTGHHPSGSTRPVSALPDQTPHRQHGQPTKLVSRTPHGGGVGRHHVHRVSFCRSMARRRPLRHALCARGSCRRSDFIRIGARVRRNRIAKRALGQWR